MIFRPLRPARLIAAPFIAFLLGVVFPERAFAEDATGSAAAPVPLVSIDSTRPFTVIERRANQVRGFTLSFPPGYVSTEQWETACVAPCSVPLDRNAVYRVGGGGVTPSGPFVLPSHTSPLHLHVHAGSDFWHSAGNWGLIVGGVAIVAGGVVAGSNAGNDARQSVINGAVIAGSGLAVLIVGAILWATTGSSVVEEDGRSL